MKQLYPGWAVLACVSLLCGAYPAVAQPFPSVPQQPVPVPNWPPTQSIAPDAAAIRTAISDTEWSPATGAVNITAPRATHSARLVNVSVRGLVTTSSVLIAGAVTQGTGTVPTLVRAIGPTLGPLGIAHPLRSPTLSIYRGSTLSATTNTLAPAVPQTSAYVGAFPAKSDDGTFAVGDAGFVGAPAVGPVTAICSNDFNSGVAMVEFYDIDSAASAAQAHYVNFSARGQVGTGENVLIAGFVVAGSGQMRLLLRGVGPSLAQFGVTDFVSDPTIALYANGSVIATNTGWQTGSVIAAAAVEDAARTASAFPLQSAGESAMIVTLSAGSYTLIVNSASNQAGSALAEVYELPPASTQPFDAAEATNAAGLDMWRRTSAQNATANVFISPYSIELALALAYAGADGDTRTQMAQVLDLPADNATLQAGFASLSNSLTATAKASTIIAQERSLGGTTIDPIQWQVANRLFGQNGYPFRDSFLTLMNDGFQAPLQVLDFIQATESARLTINSWVEQQTYGKIVDLIPPYGVSRYTRLALVNALYLKAGWNRPFSKSATTPRPFHLTPTSSIDVPTMFATQNARYVSDDGFTVAALDLLGEDLQCLFILPAATESLAAASSRLTTTHLTRWAKLDSKLNTPIDLYLPKFTVHAGSVSLGTLLQSLGMTFAFDLPAGSANFDGIAPRTPGDHLAISDVFHQVYFGLDESGVEAAAATAVVTGVTAVPTIPPEVHIDRPFLVAVQQRSTGVCLFLGQIADPSE